MKKLLSIFILSFLTMIGYGQTAPFYRNIVIQKAAPLLHLNGTDAQINFYAGDLTLTQSANTLTLAGGDLALGLNNLTMTGSLAATGSRILKGWFTDLEITNLPTINGGTLKAGLGFTTVGDNFVTLVNPSAITFPRINADNTITALSAANFKTALTLTSADVGLGNVTNNVQVNLADSIPGIGHYGSNYDLVTGLAGKANTALSNLASVAINTSLLPVGNGAMDIGDATHRMDDAYLDSASVINFYNGDMTITHGKDSLKFAGGYVTFSQIGSDLALGANGISMTGNISSAGNEVTHGYFDDITVNNPIRGNLRYDSLIFAVGDTIQGVALADSGVYNGGYVTPTDLDVAVAGAGGGVNNTVFVQLSDTIPICVFSGGGGNNSDTVYFTTSSLYGSWFNSSSDTIKVTELRANMIAGLTPSGTDTLSIQVYWNDTLNVIDDGADSLNAAPLGINSTTTGTVDASFTSDEIPPGVWVWMKTPGVVLGRKPNMMTATLSGYKIPQYIDRFSNVRMLSDTIPLATFPGGGGNNGDTLSFTTSTIYGAFFNKGSDTLNITELRVVMVAGLTPSGTDTLSVDIFWHANLNDGSPTKLNAAPLGCNSTTTGTIDTSFANAKIPPGVWVWAETPGVVLGRKPNAVLIQISGYKTPNY